jgi:putative acetyltransferase
MEIRIRPELADDVEVIEAVTTAAFLNAPHTAHTEQFVVAALRRAGALSISLAAEVDGAVVGHVAVSPVSLSDGTKGWFGLGPISVVPALQGRGIGSYLMRDALEILRTRGAAGCVLVGDPGYYERFGFRAEPKLSCSGVPPQNLLALPFGSPAPKADITFHAAFGAQA